MKISLSRSLYLLKSNWHKLISPTTVGALEITSTSIKYMLAGTSSVTQASLRLPHDIIEQGSIKNATLLAQALKNIHRQITPNQNKVISVVLSVPQNLIYAQSFTVPLASENELIESIGLNLQMISPTNFDESFHDYQEIGTRTDLGQVELLGAFIPRSSIEELTTLLKQNGFLPIIIEFPALSLARLIRLRWGGMAQTEDYLIVYLSSEGLMALIMKKGHLAFSRFTPWHEIGKDVNAETLDFQTIKEFIVEDLNRVLNFYSGRTGAALTNAVLVSPVFNYEIITLVQERLKLTLHNLAIPELPALQPSWLPLLGSSLRGSMPRSKDNEITLAEQSAQTGYKEERVINFISMWRNVTAGTLVVALASLAVITHIFSRQETYFENRVSTELSSQSTADNELIKQKIATFNAQVQIMESTRSRENSWSYLLTELKNTASNDIALRKITVDERLNFVLSGSAKNDEKALEFKEALMKLPFVRSANLPLNQITRENESAVFFDKLSGTLSHAPTSTTNR